MRATVRQRLGSLTGPALELLRIGAVIGREFEIAALSAIVNDTIISVMERLQPAEAIRVVYRADRESRMRFVHALFREVLYEEIPLVERLELHQRVGLALESGSSRVEAARLAHHFRMSAPLGTREKAIEYALAAGDAASAALAHEEAVRLYRDALELLDGSPSADDTGRAAALLRLGEAMWKSGAHRESTSILRESAHLAASAGDHEVAAKAWLAIGAGHLLQEDLVPSDVTAMETVAEQIGEDLLGIRLLARAGQIAASNPTFGTADSLEHGREATSRAAAAAEEVGDLPTLGYALFMQWFSLSDPRFLDARLKVSDRLVDVADTAGALELRVWSHMLKTVDLVSIGNLGAAHGSLSLDRSLCEEMRQPFYLLTCVVADAAIEGIQGHFDTVNRLLEELVEGKRYVEGVTLDVMHADHAADLYMNTGRVDEAVELWLSMQEVLPPVPWAGAAVRILAEAGRESDARRYLDQLARDRFAAVVSQPFLAATTIANLAAGCWYMRAEEHADVLYELLAPYERRHMLNGVPPIAYRGNASLHLGMMAHLAARPQEAISHLHAADEIHLSIGALPYAVRTKLVLAEITRADNETREAHLLETAAVELAQQIGMRIPSTGTAEATPSGTNDPSKEIGRFEREGEVWAITFGGKTTRLRGSKGIDHIVSLLQAPGRELHALQLATGDASRGFDHMPSELASSAPGPEPMVDDEAMDAYRRRIADLEKEILEAHSWGDPERAAVRQSELDAIVEELARTMGLRGHSRELPSAAERARLNVSRAIHRTLGRISDSHPELGEHLTRSIRTGIFCTYDPDRRAAVAWEIRS